MFVRKEIPHSTPLPSRTVRRYLLALSALVSPNHALAEWQHELWPGVSVNGRLEAGFAAVTMENAALGLGRIDFRTGVNEGDPSWTETHVKPIVSFTSAAGWYGQASVVGAATFGDGDPIGFTQGGDGGFEIETAVLGWRSGAPEDDSEPVFDFSLGRQTMDIGDGFLIDDGNLDFGDDGGVWLLPRQAFQRTVRLGVDYRAWHGDFFFLEADPDNDEPALAGGNLEYRFASGHAGLLYFHIIDADAPKLFAARDGMEVISARLNDLRLAVLPQVAWWGEATHQFGDGRFGRFDSSAWYAEAIYHFELPWRPRLSYRHAYFSGDKSPLDSTRRDFDPLFYGFDKRSWGTWFQGEVTGGWLLFNNNQRNHLVHLA